MNTKNFYTYVITHIQIQYIVDFFIITYYMLTGRSIRDNLLR